jgi:peptide deformylase
MAVLPIYVAPHPVLKKIAEPVAGAVTDAHRKLMDDMTETMYAAHGVGLAAPQVGVSLRIIVMDIEQREGVKGKVIHLVNPEVTWESEELNVYTEGCLSVPDQFADVERPKRVKLKYLDYHGTAHEVDADGFLATAVQHEIDHLNGILFVDHLSSLKRDMLLRKVKKWARDNADDIKESHIL